MLHTSDGTAMMPIQEMKIEDVDKTMDEINEQRQNMQDLTDVLSQPIGAGVDIDEDDLENELKVGLDARCPAQF